MPRVLVAEDEHSISMLVTYILRQQGYEVHLAENGQQAMDALNANTYDLLIADIKMPIMDGLQLIKRAKHAFRTLPVIVISAHLQDAAEATHSGADAYVLKPFTRDKLLDVVRKYLGMPEDTRDLI
jgi:DNA-binding response OmpR family regulator